MLKNSLLAVAAVVVLAFSAASVRAQELVVGTFADVPPFEFINSQGSYAGIDINIMESIARESGLTVRFVNQPFDTLLDSLAQGRFHAVASAVTINDQRRQTVDFSDPYFEVKLVAVVPNGARPISSLDDIRNMKVSVLTGTTCAAIVDRTMGAHNENVRKLGRYDDVFKDVTEGRSDVAIVDEPIAREYAKDHGGFTIGANAMYTEQYGIAVKKGDVNTLAIINKGLKAIKESGEFDIIHNIWFPQGELLPAMQF